MVQPPPSLRRIGKQIGVSHVTVSLALRNDPRLPVATRERVQAKAKELGYRPNPLVHSLMAQVRAHAPVRHTTTIGFVTGFPTRDGWRKASHLYRQYFDGTLDRASQLGYHIEEVWAKEPDMTGQRLTQVLRARNIRGLIIGPVPPARGHLSIDWSQFASAALGYSLTRPDLHRAVPNHYQAMTLVVRKLKRLKYRRIGFAMPSSAEERVNHANLAALLLHQSRQRTSDRVPPLLMKAAWNEAALKAWLFKYRPDVVVAPGGMLAQDIRRLGQRVPEDVAVVSLQWTAERAFCAGVEQHARLVGAAALDLVAGQLQRNEFGVPVHPKLVMIKGEWVDGETVRKA